MRVCMLAYADYEFDNRIIRYAETLIERGDEVDVIAIKKKGASKFKRINGVNVYRIQERYAHEKTKFEYLFNLTKFLINSFVFLTKKHIKDPYKIIHVHSVPDFEVFATLIAKMMGAKIILDIHDIVPEFYISKFGSKENSIIFKLLVLVEKVSIWFSDYVIVANHIWEKRLISRSIKPKKCTTIMNFPDQAIFKKHIRTENNRKFVMIYPGTYNWHQGLDIAIKAFKKIVDKIPNAYFYLYGGGPSLKELEELIEMLDLKGRVIFKEPVSTHELPKVLANADLGIVPKRNDLFGGEAFSTKTLEFMSVGLPFILSKTRIDQYYFDESVVKFFEPEDEKDLAEAMLLLIRNPELRENLVKNALKFMEKNNWDVKKHIYLDLVDSLVTRS